MKPTGQRKPYVVFSLAVRDSGNAALDALATDLELPKVEILTRLVEWFAGQPAEMQRSILATPAAPMANPAASFQRP